MNIPDLHSIHIDRHAPLQQQLYRQIVANINDGLWLPGSRLPASRQIAAELQLSRNTVTTVLAQMQAEGYLQARPGSGVYIHQSLPRSAIEGSQQLWQQTAALPALSDYGRQLAAMKRSSEQRSLPFTLGVPDLSAFPSKIWAQLQRRHQDRQHLLGYDSYQGYLPLRQALARYLRLSRQVRGDAGQIIITQGAQQAISLCAQVLLNKGDAVLMEDPGYGRALQAFLAHRAQVIPVPVDERGLLSASLPTQSAARLMYVTPTHHYPLGGIMSAGERLKLLDWAASRQTWLIEDDYDSEFHFHGKPIAALQGMARETPVLYMGSFSKTLFPSLRLGYLVVPPALVGAFVTAKSHADGESPLLSQAIAADFIEEGHFSRHLRRMRQLYRQKWEHMAVLVEQRLTGLAQPVAESAGMHLVLRIPGVDDVALCRDFTQAGFGGSPLSSYYLANSACSGLITSACSGLTDSGRSGLVLGFANSSETQREAGIAYLRQWILDRQRQKEAKL